jgi:hypothetical protein
MNLHSFILEFRSSAPLSNNEEQYLITIEGSILYYPDDDETLDDDESVRAGKLKAYYVDLDGARNDGYEPFDILDMEASTAEFYPVLFDNKTKDFKESLCELTGTDFLDSNLLILDRVEVLPAYRGVGLGLASIYRCMQRYQYGCGIIALKCFPLQFECHSPENDEWKSNMNLPKFESNEKAARKKLASYYGHLGFERVKRSEIMVLSPIMRQPNFSELNLGRKEK